MKADFRATVVRRAERDADGKTTDQLHEMAEREQHMARLYGKTDDWLDALDRAQLREETFRALAELRRTTEETGR